MHHIHIRLWALLLALLGAPESSRAAPADSPWGAKYFPDVTLTTHEGKKVRFYDDLIKDKHVVVSFVYTHCSKQCGLTTANLVRVQRELGDRVGKTIHFYSITLDPEHDTPEEMNKYRLAFKARPGWTFLTGSKADIDALKKKFGDMGPIEDHPAMVNIGNDALGQWFMTGSIDNPSYLAGVIGNWLDPSWSKRKTVPSYVNAPRVAAPTQGHKVFSERCAMCHVRDGESVGPDLRGVVGLRGRAWITRWLREPEKLVAEKDPIATALLARHKVQMPNLGLTEYDINEVINYLDPDTHARAAPVTYGLASPRR